MTCVLSSPWQPFNSGYEWSPMNTTDGGPASLAYDRYQQGYASSESESRHTSNYSGKKRPSRAGTRSVTTLSAAQLERKRANDREAQRAIRQRTKEHIEGLEKNLSDLQVAKDASEQLTAVTQQRNRELEEEVAYLRVKLDEAGLPVNVPSVGPQRPAEQGVLSVQTTSPPVQTSNNQRTDSTGTPQSAFSLPVSHSSTSRQGSWQHNHNGNLDPANQPPHTNVAQPGSMQVMQNLSTWRSHDSSQSIQSAPSQMQDPSQREPPTPYGVSSASDPAPWTGPPLAYAYQEQPRPIKYEHPGQPQPHYAQTAVPAYSPNPHQPAYQAPVAPPLPPPPPQTAFQGMTVSTPVTYQVHPPNYPPPPQYQIPAGPGQSSPAYGPQHGQMHPLPPQPPPPPTTQAYHPAPVDQYAHIHPPMAFRDETGSRTYSLTHYPTG